MKLHTITIILIFIIISAISLYLLIPETGKIENVTEKNTEWIIKEKEIKSRLLSVPILLYHDIDSKGPYSINHDMIKSQFQLLKDNNIKVIPLSELINSLLNPRPFDQKTISITFDDGFLSMYTKLLPTVKEYEYPVTIFVYTDNIYNKGVKNITWNRLRKMQKQGIEIECHSISHDDLTILSEKETISSRKKLFEEIYLSKRIIELYLHKKIRYFAFPYGRYNLDLLNMCRFSGYERVFSTDYRSHIITRDNYCLGRGHIKNNYSLEFIKKIAE